MQLLIILISTINTEYFRSCFVLEVFNIRAFMWKCASKVHQPQLSKLLGLQKVSYNFINTFRRN